MSKYLLLRDNKQTGPHTLDEIRALGLKKYDLIWVEGKSAAWRYAGEIEEMKSFAPEMEEQPFDRFFRKPVREEHHQLRKEDIKPLVPAIQSTEQKPSQKLKEKRYVAITLPSGKKPEVRKVMVETPANTKQVKPSQPEKVIQNKVAEIVTKLENPLTQERLMLQREQQQGSNTLQYVALGVAITSIMLIIVLVSSNEYDIKTYPVSKSPVNRAEPIREAVQPQSLQTIPAVNIPEDEDPLITEAAVPAERKTVIKRAVSTTPTPTLKGKKITTAAAKPAPSPAPERKLVKLSDNVRVSLSDYRVNIFGGMDDIRVTVANTSPYKLDMVVVELQYLQSNKKVFKTETLRFKGIEPGASMTLDAPKTNRGIGINSRLSYITSKAAGVSENL